MKISIITVTFNSEKTLQDTLDSVLQQDYRNIEHIIIDGGSTDSTVDLIRAYASKTTSHSVKWVSEKDRGIYDAMNKGIAMATGEVIGILNSDDYFTSNDVISKLINPFSDEEIDAVYGDIHFIHDKEPEKITRYYSSKMFSPFWIRFGFMPAHPSLYVRKEIYDKVGLYKLDYKIGADFEMVVRMFHVHKIKAHYINMDFVTMRNGGASTSGVQSHKLLLQEDARACRENGLYSNQFLISLKYLYKVFEFRI
ncbi:glycosyltransferase family 2 protein [Prevotella melaninogenica]|uniref:Glycosyl transferase n=1 Tax=Prevotella melaninogenica DNF00666 TaxID=1401073 RepID=A0A096AH65_9BACT|nr:glycosyltransferase family 2 protein [Prevotella melaninogenica]KGF46215.1 glycosyl transferase [Prevotella melaninogenica DNF00666]